MSGYTGMMDVTTPTTEHNALEFVAKQLIGKMATATVVKITAVSSNSEAGPPGRLSIQPMVHQIDGDGNTTPHGEIHNIPFHRHGGGTDAIISDPKVGDIGIVVHASRDISAVKETRDFAGPGSRRRHDWADAIYIGQTLNLTPTQFVRFHADGIEITTPGRITINAQNVTLDRDGNLAVTGEIQRGHGTADQVTLGQHRHGTGTPTPGTSVPTPGT